MPSRNRTEEMFSANASFYLELRSGLLEKFPEMEGRWLLASKEPYQIFIGTSESQVLNLRSQLNCHSAYFDCLGREVMIYHDLDDVFDDVLDEGESTELRRLLQF